MVCHVLRDKLDPVRTPRDIGFRINASVQMVESSLLHLGRHSVRQGWSAYPAALVASFRHLTRFER